MPGKSNAATELVKFWLQDRHGCLVDEEYPVPVPYALSDIDIVAIRADLQRFALPDGSNIGPRVIVEVKAEHDWDATGSEFGTALRSDLAMMGSGYTIPAGSKGVKFVMLREEHAARATELFGTADYDRLFIVHALDPSVRTELTEEMGQRRIFWITLPELIADLVRWYESHPRKAALRRNPTGDLLHLLFSVGGLRIDA